MNLRPVLLMLPVLLACADTTSDATDWNGTMDTLANGTIVVRNPDAPVWTSTSGWRLEEELRIGAVEGAGPSVFGRIAAVAQDSAGRVYVLDAQAQQVRVFDRAGEFVHSIGKRGSGPGEFSNVFGFTLDGQGQLWTADVSAARYQVFDQSGALQRSYRRTGGVVHPFLGGFDALGRLYDVAPAFAQPGITQYHYAALDTATAQLDSVPPLINARASLNPPPMIVARLLPRLTFQFDRRGFLWFAMTDQYRIHQRSLKGDTVRIIEKVATPLEVPNSEREAIAQQIRKEFPNEPAARIPNRRPLFQRLVLDEAGFLYTMLAAPDGAAETILDVFDPAGRYLGQLRVPEVLTVSAVPVFTRDHLLGVTQNADGVNYVVRYRIVRPKLQD